MISKRNSKRGFTLLEMMMAFTLLAMVMLKAQGAMKAASQGIGDETKRAMIEDQARRVLRQVGFAVMGSDRASLLPGTMAPISTENLRYRVNLGVQDGEVVWSDREMVAMDTGRLNVYWAENPDEANEKKVVWSKLVAPYLQGEILNGIDDNGNGLVDETGLSFVIQGNAVTIRLTLQLIGENDEPLTRTVETTVTCRNLEGSE
ncbi:MAG: prepilin-type N-terminal cleavage/methylation domain-containing protein [Planctomycetes bacterium]|nr:prepilin-type N-terminal cleavage/methylation domain-containing protein [Planctomycetota bacterium]